MVYPESCNKTESSMKTKKAIIKERLDETLWRGRSPIHREAIKRLENTYCKTDGEQSFRMSVHIKMCEVLVFFCAKNLFLDSKATHAPSYS